MSNSSSSPSPVAVPPEGSFDCPDELSFEKFDSGALGYSPSMMRGLEEELDNLDFTPGQGRQHRKIRLPNSLSRRYQKFDEELVACPSAVPKVASGQEGLLQHRSDNLDCDLRMNIPVTFPSTSPLTCPDNKKKDLYSPPPQEQFASFRRVHLLICMTVFSTLTSLLTIFYVVARYSQFSRFIGFGGYSVQDGLDNVSRIGFGSCLQRHIGQQPVWQSVISVKPHVWIWLGDFVYADSGKAHPIQQPNNGTTVPPHCRHDDNGVQYCNAVGESIFIDKFMQQLQQEDYLLFLRYMCPNAGGSIPPNARHCSRDIIGTWDDHDMGINDGVGMRLNYKNRYKQIFLDGMLEPQDSSRRSGTSGMEYLYMYNKGDKKKEISVFLLDERYYREPVPCEVHWDRCQEALKNNETQASFKSFCEDFMIRGIGCCAKDDFMWNKDDGWCIKNVEGEVPKLTYEELCEPASTLFGTRAWSLEEEESPVLHGKDSSASFCDILGSTQRTWLQKELSRSVSRINIIASSSVVLSRAKAVSSDSWEVYNPARKNFISTIAKSDASCVVILTGDFHFADIKVLRNKAGMLYTEDFMSSGLKYPLYQVMSSGMTDDMSRWVHEENASDYLEDPLGLRESLVLDANFGLIDIDWYNQVMSLQIRFASNGTVAAESSVDLRSCTRHKSLHRKPVT
eukprot:GHVQ01039091.1.p1 GENE.GHVQ01039091.1~~GHVQ01039091.1.p1  ORF type:complete len:680 (+),score=59.72 GHVQ01039091.1:452-2491(+)